MIDTGKAVEQFLYSAFRLLDGGEFGKWMETWATELVYVVQTAGNLERGSTAALINDNRDRLIGRIASIEQYWHAEVPRTRTSHLVGNIEVEPMADGTLVARSRFIVSATRLGTQVMLAGRYEDVILRQGQALRLRSRLAVLDNDLLVAGRVTYIV